MAVASAAAVAAAALASRLRVTEEALWSGVQACLDECVLLLQFGVSGPLETKFPCEDSFDQKQRLSALCQWDGVLF